MIASGARRDKLNNPNYYQNLLKLYPTDVPFPQEEPINLDLHRTFPEEYFFQKEENIQKLKNVLMAFAMRNLTIGYCQGFNYIVGKLLMEIDDEEDVFWIFTEIVENYLPFDFYIKFSGVRIDLQIVKKIICSNLPNIEENAELCISNMLTKCFISLFTQNVNMTILRCIWDAFFIYGNIILYRAFIWAIFLLYDNTLIDDQSIENIHSKLSDKFQKVSDKYTLNYFLMMNREINKDYIEHNRRKFHKQDKEKFLHQVVINKDDAQNCRTSLPFCLCNKDGEKNFIKEYNCLKWGKKIEIVNNYFFGNNKESEIEDISEDYQDIDDCIIERQKHHCRKE